MKRIFPLLIFFCSCYNLVPAKTLSREIEREMISLQMSSSGYLYMADPAACTSCNYGYLELLSELSKKRAVYYIFKNRPEELKFLRIAGAGNSHLKNLRTMTSEKLYDYFFSYKLVHYAGNKFDVKDVNSIGDDYRYEWREFKTDTLPERSAALSYDLFKSRGTIYAFNRDIGEIRFRNANGKTDSIALYANIDRTLLFESLKLNSQDSLLTKRELFDGVIPGNRLVDFMFFCPSADSEHFFASISLNYVHCLTEAEITDIKAVNPALYNEMKQVRGDITTIKNKLMLLEFDRNWQLTAQKEIGPVPDHYQVDFYTPFYVSHAAVYGNLKYYPEEQKEFQQGNFAFALFRDSSNILKFMQFSAHRKPLWSVKNKVYNNFSNFSLQKDDAGSVDYCMISFPYAIHLPSVVKYEIPYDQLKKVAKAEKNKKFGKPELAFLTLGMVTLDETQKGMLIKSMATRHVYLLVFDANGAYRHCQLLAKGTDYIGNIWFFDGFVCQLEENFVRYYRID